MNAELAVFILYLIGMLCIGVFFFMRSKGGEKEYFLGGRKVSPWVAALSAGASDMSAWVLMGLPASIYLFGVGQAWIAVGLAAGYVCSWIFVAPRLRKFSIAANDSITLPQYLTNRFLSKNKALQLICAVIFIIAYAIYAASSIKAAGTLFNTVVGIDERFAMYMSAAIIIGYVFFGGFMAVTFTDFIQGMLMLGALMLAPIFALFMLETAGAAVYPENYWNLLSGGSANWSSAADILNGFGWGLGYFGMPHIIIRFMAIRSQKEVKKSAVIGITWNILILGAAVAVGLIGRTYLGDIDDSSVVFITMVRRIFPAVISGVVLSAILAAAMSTADSQLLTAGSAFAADVYKPMWRKNASDKEMFWAGRFVVIAIAAVAVLIAANPNSGNIMDLVGNAWGIFGAAFGPVILLSLFWKRLNIAGATAGIVTGAAVDILWLVFLSDTGLYEIIPGFAAGILAAVAATLLTKAPDKAVGELFEKAVVYED